MDFRKSLEEELLETIHTANMNKKLGVEDHSGFTSMGLKVFRLRGGVSQGSDCDSDGVPGFMQGGFGNDYEEMELIRNRREVEDFQVLEAGEANNREKYVQDNVSTGDVQESSLLGGIPVEKSPEGCIDHDKVVVEDYVTSDDEEVQHVSDMEALEKETLHRFLKRAYETNRRERNALFSL